MFFTEAITRFYIQTTLRKLKPKRSKHSLQVNVRGVTPTVPYGTSEYLVETIQLALNKNKYRVIDFYTFAQKAKTWEMYQDEVQVS